MDIYLKEKGNTKSSLRFPSVPESIKAKGSASYQEYDIIGKGTYAFPAGTDLYTIQWKGMFWGEERKKIPGLNRKWLSPSSCIKKLEQWKEKGTILNLVVSGGNINRDVTIKSFEYEQTGGRGDYEYSIAFVSYASSGYNGAAGKAKITYTNPGSAHPWHLEYINWEETHVYGWVDEGTFD